MEKQKSTALVAAEHEVGQLIEGSEHHFALPLRLAPNSKSRKLELGKLSDSGLAYGISQMVLRPPAR